jgi:hypothetical protein
VAVVLAQSLCRAIGESSAEVADGAERVAIGQRRYVQLAAEHPAWAMLLLDWPGPIRRWCRRSSATRSPTCA